MYFFFGPQDPLTTCRSERCVATLWCCCGNHQCTRAAIRSTGSTLTSRRRRRQRRRGEESTPRLRRRRTSRSPSSGWESRLHRCDSSCNLVFLLFSRLRIWRKQRRMCSVCALRIRPVLERLQMWRSRSQLLPNQVRKTVNSRWIGR